MDDGSNPLPSIFFLLLLLLAAAYFALCETAFASVSRPKLRTAAERGDKRARKAVFVTENFDRAITTILIGSNIIHLTAASYVTVLVTRRWGTGAVTLSTFITTIVVFFAGEMLPKSIGKKYSESLSIWSAGSLCFFMRVFAPAARLLTAIGNGVARLGREPEVSVTEDELYDIIENMTGEGGLDEEQGELVHSALSFGEATAESILTARVDMAAVNVDEPAPSVLSFIRGQRHSHFPVYQDSIDNIIGVLPLRRFIRAWLDSGESLGLRSLLDEPVFVHQSTHIDELLAFMSAKKTNLAIVTDNYGGTLGLVTVEDILEELVGDIWDEDDEVVETRVREADGSFSFDASLDIEDALDYMGYEDPDDTDFQHKLLGEWAYEQFSHIPEEGEGFVWKDLSVTVTELENRRIRKLNIRLAESPEAEGRLGA